MEHVLQNPAVMILLGWLLSELSQRFRTHGHRRGAVGRALTELLDVRHRLRGLETVLSELKTRFQVTPADELALARLLEQVLPADKGIEERYSRALTDMAEDDPVLAFRVRSKDQIPAILSRIRESLAAQAGSPAVDLEKFLRIEALAPLEEVIRSLAWKHDVRTWFRLRKQLRKPADATGELKEAADRVFSLFPQARHDGEDPAAPGSAPYAATSFRPPA